MSAGAISVQLPWQSDLGSRVKYPENKEHALHDPCEKFSFNGLGSTTKKLCGRQRDKIYFFFWGNIHMRTPTSLPVNASLSHLMLLSFSANKEQWSKDSSLLYALVLIHSQSQHVLYPLLHHLNWVFPQRDPKRYQRGFMLWYFLISGCVDLQPKYWSSKSLLLPSLIKEKRKEASYFQLEREVLACPRAAATDHASSADPFSKCGGKSFEIQSGRHCLPFFQGFTLDKLWQLHWTNINYAKPIFLFASKISSD